MDKALETIINYEAEVAFKKVGTGVSRVSIEDFQQEAWLVALQAMPKFDPSRGQITTFIANCVRNHLGKFAKRANKRDSYGISRDSLVEQPIIDRTDLSDVETTILYYMTEQNLSIDGIADWMEISIGEVTQHLRNICQKLES